MNGKLIVIDGVDASGKHTQTSLLYKKLKAAGRQVKKLEFPNYADASSALVKMYLSGEFGTRPSDVNGYAASVFYACDRYASYKKHWEDDYRRGDIMLCDRYTTSNAIYQSAKMPLDERDSYLSWLYDFEYGKLELPAPDLVIFLDMPPEYAAELMQKRYLDDQSRTDIHEKDFEYLRSCYEAAVHVCEKWGWTRIPCVKNEKIRSIEEINDEIAGLVMEVLFSVC